jgi:putative DNA primase/helicase
MIYLNDDSVLAQLEAFGLILDGKNWPPITFDKPVRTKFEGKRGTPGWYVLHEDHYNNETRLTGAYGYWEDTDNHSQTIILDEKDIPKLTDEQKAEKRRIAAAAAKKAKNIEKAKLKTASLRAQWIWNVCHRRGEAEYHTRKQIQPMGVRYSPESWDDIFPNLPEDLFPKAALASGELKLPPTNSIIVPMQDESGTIHMLQAILDRQTHRETIKKLGTDKIIFPKGGGMVGKYHQIGPMITTIALVAEGYATAITLHLATGLPVIIVFSAGNIKNVMEVLLPYYASTTFLICADDDDLQSCQDCKALIQLSRCKDGNCHLCGQPHGKTNAGIDAAFRACTDQRIKYIRPKFPNQDDRYARYVKNKGKLTDFNDLHISDSLSAVRSQLEKGISGLELQVDSAARVQQVKGGGESALRRIETGSEAIERYSLIYAQKGTVFDHECKILMSKDDMRDVCSREIMDQWQLSDHRRIYDIEQVGFDPTEQDESVVCNLWKGWPIEPKQGDCSLILELLEYLCSAEDNAAELYEYVLDWCAYPLQNPGAKLPTAIVIHGGQGCGKNLYAEAVMACYGDFGKVIDQDCLEDKHNDFFSKKLLLVADEVVGRSDRYHVVNKLKGIITGKKIRINPKNIASYDEKNHINLFFLANGFIPVVIEQDDRRHLVIYVPEKREKEFYIKVKNQIDNGGIAAFFHFLLNRSLSHFNPHAPLPVTQAKTDLINLNKDAFQYFYEEFINGEIIEIVDRPFLGDDFWELFKLWCVRKGERPGKQKYMLAELSRKAGIDKLDRQHIYLKGYGKVQRTIYYPPKVKDRGFEDLKSFHETCVAEFQKLIEDYRNGG